ncbi:MAG: 4Fe-4S dicluster domain-containing protein [Desulfobacterales bacterium]|nr:4Fe-4S dicluster domain-containing protein [Desulfobacterales bacterium]
MFFSVALYTSLIIFTVGMIYKISKWFSLNVGYLSDGVSVGERVFSAITGIIKVIFSPKIMTVIKVFVMDGILQIRTLKEDPMRWVMHVLIYWGFMLLLFMHALEKLIIKPIFPNSCSTLNPFFFLREIFGLMVVAGIGIAIYRRFILRPARLKTNAMDIYAIAIVAIIMLSGFMLEGAKMSSYSAFEDMVSDYGVDESEIPALEAYWVKDFGTVSPNELTFGEDVLQQGKESHEAYCASCHSANKSAFVGYGIAKTITPVALIIDKLRINYYSILWYIHILACFFGLAYLPFSKMFHIFATPVSLITNAVMDKNSSNKANVVTRQAMEIDACTHCGTCSLHCSAMMASEAIGNCLILPSEKMACLKKLVSAQDLSDVELAAIQEGIYICSNCDKCTVVCPSGINLKELWLNVRECLIQKWLPEPSLLSPFSITRGVNKDFRAKKDYSKPLNLTQRAMIEKFLEFKNPEGVVNIAGKDEQLNIEKTFAYCFGCQNCSTICPVVKNYENPQEVLGLLPHQIMCAMGMGLFDVASSCKMIWDCLTCYQCQEHCPQNVKVTDILYTLKNKSIEDKKQELIEKQTCGKEAA